jgi:uncharacterized BrkB/YihY/UPF0761 family membrane protein
MTSVRTSPNNQNPKPGIVWIATLRATAMLYAADLFFGYLKDFAMLNAVYGAFDDLPFRVHFIFGACLCATQAEERVAPMVPYGAFNTGQ